MTKPKRRVASLFIDGKAATFLGMVGQWIVVQIGTSRPICLSLDEFERQMEKE